jgi:hypothetical protein
MAWCVRDAAMMLIVLAMADPQDPATAGRPQDLPDFTAHLCADALRG